MGLALCLCLTLTAKQLAFSRSALKCLHNPSTVHSFLAKDGDLRSHILMWKYHLYQWVKRKRQSMKSHWGKYCSNHALLCPYNNNKKPIVHNKVWTVFSKKQFFYIWYQSYLYNNKNCFLRFYCLSHRIPFKDSFLIPYSWPQSALALSTHSTVFTASAWSLRPLS